MGRRCNWNSEICRDQPEKGDQGLRWPYQWSETPGTLWCRDLFQGRPGHELPRERSMVEGQGERGHACLGNERRAIAQDPRLSIESGSAGIYRRSKC